MHSMILVHPKELEIDDNSFEFQMDDIKSKLAVMRKLHLKGIYLMVTILKFSLFSYLVTDYACSSTSTEQNQELNKKNKYTFIVKLSFHNDRWRDELNKWKWRMVEGGRNWKRSEDPTNSKERNDEEKDSFPSVMLHFYIALVWEWWATS